MRHVREVGLREEERQEEKDEGKTEGQNWGKKNPQR